MWGVKPRKGILNNLKKFPEKVQKILFVLIKELKEDGPYRKNWANYGKLKGHKDTFHCHIKKGNPTIVAIWSIKDKKIKLLEVTYVGTHEKAPY
jgi:mRNA-degrading endonuclease RelE of RelBE toxin-antitoxin system